MTVKEFIALAIGTPVIDDQDDACVVVGTSAEVITVAYGDDDACIFAAHFRAFELAGPGVRWNGQRWHREEEGSSACGP